MTQPPDTELRRSSRDPSNLQSRLETWLADLLPPEAAPTITNLGSTTATGMSSETVLFDAEWTGAGTREIHPLVARLAPDTADVPVFPTYDMAGQFEALRVVAATSDVPVPSVRWLDATGTAIGTPFFVMDRVDGLVPPDVMPYTFGDNWLHDAPVADQQRLQDATVSVLARLHGIEDPSERFSFLRYGDRPGDWLGAHVARRRDWYEFVSAGGPRSPLIERGFDWLDSHWPTEVGDPVLSWGDARIGNVLYRDFAPVAILDWEMAGIGPRELDVAWLLNSHRVFEDLAHGFELPGLPDFLRIGDVASEYERLTGYAPRDIEFYMTYASIQFAIVFLRTGQRSVRFGEREMPDDVDEFLYNREPLQAMIDGSYWADLP